MMLPFCLAALPSAASPVAGSSYARRLAQRHLRCLAHSLMMAPGINDNDADAYRSTANYTAASGLARPVGVALRLVESGLGQTSGRL